MEKMIIKIKIPQAGSELQFRCPFCEKAFSSGKALGGHKRVHLQRGNNNSHHRRDLQITNLEAETPEKKFSCPVCNQMFISEKSVHGHMRKHPERNWRGMKPPVPEVENCNSLVPVSDSLALEGNHSADQIQGDNQMGSDLLLLEWPRTGRRSRHGKSPMNIPSPDQELAMSGVYDLMALANGEPTKEDFASKKKKLELSVSSISGNPGCSSKNKKAVVLGGGYSLENSDNLVNPGPQSLIRGKKSLFVDKNNVYKIPIRGQKQYVCTICDRTFRSYQALGGHKSHHNIKIGKVRSPGEDDESAAVAAGALVPYVERPHRCPFCDQIFPTGEALGDHRQHCNGPAPVDEVPFPGGEQESRNQPTVFRFDLNELPPEWTDGGW
ncbi:hypothetical protein Pfo_006735 [Paulownia fortunei]|nr:hypothetical protein Pfo_006735 [Paulownia fortunei]